MTNPHSDRTESSQVAADHGWTVIPGDSFHGAKRADGIKRATRS